MIPKLALEIRNNETFDEVLQLTDNTGRPLVGIGTWDLLLEIRDTAAIDGVLLYTLSTTVGNITFDTDVANNAKVILTIPLADAIGFTWTNGFFDLMYMSAGKWKALAEGTVTVVPGVTDPRD